MKRTGKQTGSIVALALTILAMAHANNIRVENVATRFQGVTENDTVYVEFDLSWENSWRNDLNHDAAWVFVKFRAPGSNHWQHAYLATNAAHHTAPGGKIELGTSEVNGVTNAMGAFIYSDHNRTGSVSYSRTRLLWDYGQSGYSFDDGEVIDISVHAIEMVYVAEGNFHVGTGIDGTERGAFTDGFFETTGERMAFLISSEDPIDIGPEEGKLWADSSHANNGIGPTEPLTAAFPKGYAAFYSMKYHITQGQYVEFLNLLTYEQQDDMIAGSPADGDGIYPHEGADRHMIHIVTSGVDSDTPAVYATDHPYVACNYLSWTDGAAYTAWAGLRPMTELEFEKAARGPAAPVADEYAWGTASISSTGLEGNYSELGEYNESVSQGNAIYLGSNPGGPARVGIFATNNATRVTAGASYWGIMEMSGNLHERPVSLGTHSSTRDFKGTHGTGTITLPADWPQNNSRGAGYRGGSFLVNSDWARVSDRARASDQSTRPTRDYGWRAVRSAPASP